MPTPEEIKARLTALRSQASQAFSEYEKKKAEKRDLDELALFDLLGPTFRLDFIVVECREAGPDLPQFVVFNRPSGPQTDRFKQQMWKDSKERGVVEAKSRAGAELARQCLKWPAAAEYEALCDANRMFPDKAAGILVEEVQAGAEAAGKG